MKNRLNSLKEKLPKFLPWGFVFMLATALILLPAYQCPLKKQEVSVPVKKEKKRVVFGRKNQKQTKTTSTKTKTSTRKPKRNGFSKKKSTSTPKTEETNPKALNDWTI